MAPNLTTRQGPEPLYHLFPLGHRRLGNVALKSDRDLDLGRSLEIAALGYDRTRYGFVPTFLAMASTVLPRASPSLT